MGNTHSTTTSLSASSSSTERKSWIFSRPSFIGAAWGCSQVSTDFSDDQLEKSTGEKSALSNESSVETMVVPHFLATTPTYEKHPPMYAGLYPSASSMNDTPTCSTAYTIFTRDFPEYLSTHSLDTLRMLEFSRLDRKDEVYVDYMGGSLYPESLVHAHSLFLRDNIFGNTHSVSSSSALSSAYAAEARSSVLSFFDASPDEYTVIFTANASAALKLVGESYPFGPDANLIIGEDSHNSVHGLRRYAAAAGAEVCYIPSRPRGGVDRHAAETMLAHSGKAGAGLFALTGQSNISNAKNPLELLHVAAALGFHTIVDAAALAPTSRISLARYPADAMAVSFYKMFGYPTGVGALVAKNSFLRALRRPWFAGGTVDVVQVPGNVVTMAHDLHEQFEDGTLNYLSLPSITFGLRFLSSYLPLLPLRISCLLTYLISELSKLSYPSTGSPLVKILSERPSPDLRPKTLGAQTSCGGVLALLFLDADGSMLPNSFIEHAAASHRISLRTGCMCNPGGAAVLLGLQAQMAQLTAHAAPTLAEFERIVGHELGVVRISLGLASDFRDVWRVVEFAREMANEGRRREMWMRYITERRGA